MLLCLCLWHCCNGVVPLSLLHCCASVPARASKFCEYSSSEGSCARRRLSAEYCETSCETSLAVFRLPAECFEASLPLLPRSLRAPSTSEPSRFLISSMSLARGNAPSCSGPCASASHCLWIRLDTSKNIFWNICTRFSFSLLGHTGLLLPSATLHTCQQLVLAMTSSLPAVGTCFIHHI